MTEVENLSMADVKTQVKTLKVELKTWEHAFLSEHQRKPQKDDIVQDKTIAKKYKLYGKMKTRLAELEKLGGVEHGSEDDVAQDVVTHVGSLSRVSALGDALSLNRRNDDKRRSTDFAAEGQVKKQARSKLTEEMGATETETTAEGEVVTRTVSVDARDRQSKTLSLVNEDESPKIVELDPIEPEPILKNPGVPFKSKHPLLSNLSFIPKEGTYTAPDLPSPEESPEYKEAAKKEQQPASPKDESLPSPAIKTVSFPVRNNKAMVEPDLFKRVPKGQVLRCKISRQGEKLDQLFPTYIFTNEMDQKFLLAARKRKKAKYPHYILTTDQDNLTKTSRGYVAKVKADASGLAFTIMDARSYSLAKEKKGLRDLAAVTYNKATLPHQMRVAIKLAAAPDDTMEPFTSDIMRDLVTDSAQVLILKNKQPSSGPNGQQGLNFYGRVTQPSIKNFQLADPVEETVVLQFGRTGEDSFILDVVHPFTPVEAFGIALTAFDAYDFSL